MVSLYCLKNAQNSRPLLPPPSPAGTSRKEITEHWEWLEHNLLQTLSIFENENDITTFVKGKVQVGPSLCVWMLSRSVLTERVQWPVGVPTRCRV